jgi:methionine-gamma-lyase
MSKQNTGFDTKLVHAGDFKDEFGSAITPIYQTSTFEFESAEQGGKRFKGEESGYIYTRLSNPTIDALENKLAALENGAGAVAFSSGMAAITAVYIAFLKQGDHMVSSNAVYGPSRVAMKTIFAGFGIDSTYVDTADLSAVEAAIQPNTKLLYLETPGNPMMQLCDIQTISEIAHAHSIPVVVDNTFCSPYLQKPLDLGADISLHSLTKFINGHGDIVAGAVISKDAEVNNLMRQTMIMMGSNIDPHQAFLIARGVKTLSLRMEKAQANAQTLAEYLEEHPKISWVNYPGLDSFPQKSLAEQQMAGFGTMMSFGVVGGYKACEQLMNHVKVALLAVSLGGVETLIQHPASMSHASVGAEARAQAGISEDMVRFSVGIEDINDLREDLRQALAAV